MATLRTGEFGNYYGSFFDDSEPLSSANQQVNAKYIYSYLFAEGWSINAIAGLLGNMQAESSINPGRWQSDNVGSTSNGYGLVQWTPATKYINWCTNNGYSDPSAMDNNLKRIIYEINNGLQWIATSKYNFSFKEFSKSNKTVSELAKAFLLNYERPADQSSSVQAYRAKLAEQWYTYLTGQAPTQPGSTSKKKKRKYNFVVFNRRKRSSL